MSSKSSKKRSAPVKQAAKAVGSKQEKKNEDETYLIHSICGHRISNKTSKLEFHVKWQASKEEEEKAAKGGPQPFREQTWEPQFNLAHMIDFDDYVKNHTLEDQIEEIQFDVESIVAADYRMDSEQGQKKKIPYVKVREIETKTGPQS